MLYSKRGVRYLRIRIVRLKRTTKIDWGLVAVLSILVVMFASILFALDGVAL